MSKHTPGPWRVSTWPRNLVGRDDAIQVEAFDAIGNRTLAVRLDECCASAERWPNARLIAQAPTMLQDLTDAAAQLRKLGGEVNAALAARFETTIAAAVGGAE